MTSEEAHAFRRIVLWGLIWNVSIVVLFFLPDPWNGLGILDLFFGLVYLLYLAIEENKKFGTVIH